MRIQNLFDRGSGIRNGKIRIRDKHPGFATLKITPIADLQEKGHEKTRTRRFS
jgi:hypothetical protein